VERKQGLSPRVLLGLVVLVVIAGGVAVLASGGSSSSSKSVTASTKSLADADFHSAGLVQPITTAPPLSLHNYLGEAVDLSSYKGKAVLVTFLYTHCPDVCPLITSNLRVAQNLMGAKTASKLQIIAVSVDPKGDTKNAVSSFLARHEMTGRMKYLIGSTHELALAWEAWGVGSERDAREPQFINHSGVIYGITASGKRLTAYAANFQPRDIAHDVPLLADR
jgi:protein SCO1